MYLTKTVSIHSYVTQVTGYLKPCNLNAGHGRVAFYFCSTTIPAGTVDTKKSGVWSNHLMLAPWSDFSSSSALDRWANIEHRVVNIFFKLIVCGYFGKWCNLNV